MGEVNEHASACPSPTRIVLSQEELSNLDKEQLVQHWIKQDLYIDCIESQLATIHSGSPTPQQDGDKQRLSLSSEYARRESFMLMKLNSKEQEMHDLTVQIQELKGSQAANVSSLRSSLLDPAVNILIHSLQKDLEKAKQTLEETQNELSAWKFTPDSNTGKRLMAKCRLLYQENEELGRMISSGRLAKLEGDLALQRNFSEEMKKTQSELDEFLLELDEDVEGMQSTIYFLQQQLRQTREHLTILQKENDSLRSGSPMAKRSRLDVEGPEAEANNDKLPSGTATAEDPSIDDRNVNMEVDQEACSTPDISNKTVESTDTPVEESNISGDIECSTPRTKETLEKLSESEAAPCAVEGNDGVKEKILKDRDVEEQT
nr:EOG090X0FYD [Macrothrix elegans]